MVPLAPFRRDNRPSCLAGFAALVVSACSAHADKGNSEGTALSVELEALASSGRHQTVPELQSPGILSTILVRAADSDGGDGATLLGQLVLSGGCVSIRAGTETCVLVASSPNVTWLSATRKLRTPSGDIAIGDSVKVGGSVASSSIAIEYTTRPSSSCPKMIWIANGVEPL